VILTLHRSQRAIFHGRRLMIHWDEWSFAPSAYSGEKDAAGFLHVRHTSIPTPVHVPIGSQVVQRNGQDRLATYFDQYGVDPASVAHLASNNSFGFRWEQWQGPGHAPAPPDHGLPGDDPNDSFELGERTRGGRRAGSPGP